MVIAAAVGMAWLAISFAVLCGGMMLTRLVMVLVLTRRAKRHADEAARRESGTSS